MKRSVRCGALASLALAVLAAACSPEPGVEFGGLHPVQRLQPQPPAGAQSTGIPPRGEVAFMASRQALAPLLLPRPLSQDAPAGAEVAMALPASSSTQAVWARVRLEPPTTLRVGPGARRVAPGSLVTLPVSRGAVRFTVDDDARVTLEPLAGVDSAGGGFVVVDEPEWTLSVEPGEVVRLDAPAGDLPDDTLGQLVRLRVEGAPGARVSVQSCGRGEPSGFDAGASPVTAWLPEGALCWQAETAVTIHGRALGRARRFSTTALRGVWPLTLLDTRSGEGGWRGTPAKDQTLRLPLGEVAGLSAGSHALYAVELPVDAPDDARVALGACGGVSVEVSGSELALLPTSEDLCLTPSAGVHVALRLVALVTPRSEAEGVCEPRPAPAACGGTSVVERLNCITGVRAEAVSLPGMPAGATQVMLHITQPVDHFRPQGETFTQRVRLGFRGFDAPVALATTGYALYGFTSDLADNFEMNELEVEHRFFESSTPASGDLNTLTIMQSAWDSHRIVELLSPLLTGAWVSTGHSKGGMTAIFHRRFFPCDVAATVPYVAPITIGKDDARAGPWMATIGGPAYATCREAANLLERGVMAERGRFAQRLAGTYEAIGGREEALWMLCNGGLLWGAFQYGQQDDPESGCPAIVAAVSQYPELMASSYAENAEGYSDEALAGEQTRPGEEGSLAAYYFQTLNELGSPGANRAHLAEYGPVPALPSAYELYAPGPHPVFEPRAMLDVLSWLSHFGERFFFLYGGFDPHSAARVDIRGMKDTDLVLVPGASHGVGLADLPPEDGARVWPMLEGWVGVGRSTAVRRSGAPSPVRHWPDVLRELRRRGGPLLPR